VKRYFYLSHRWLGIVICLFMAMWFFSGVVMLYVGYPKLSTAERLAVLPHLNATGDINSVLKQRANPEHLRLTTVGGKTRFIAQYGKADYLAVDEQTGQKINHTSESDTLTAAQNFLNSTGDYQGTVDEDPWTHSRALDGFRPLHKVQMHDEQNTLLYVASSTGEVVRDATGTERVWNWVGSWIHWLYPFRGGSLSNEASANIIIYSSLIGCFLVLTGIVIGVWRWKFKGQYKHGGKTPYKSGMMRWHHITGLVFGLITFTWILSGLFSMNPWKIFDSGAKLNIAAYQAGQIENSLFPLGVQQAIQILQNTGFYPVELQWQALDGKGYYIAFNNQGNSQILAAETGALPLQQFPYSQLELAAQRAMGEANLNKTTILSDYDAYYYQRANHTMSGHIEKRLPILRLEFDDPYTTWLHIDPYTGELSKLDSYKRTSRWLFNFLHSWDWLPLLNSRPLWDSWMIGFSLGGFILSVSGVIIGWRRLKS
jgi:hypothetical protein